MRNNGRTSDIYRPNEAFVRPFVISPDILSGGVAAGVEFHMSNPHPSVMSTNVVSAVCAQSKCKQPCVVGVQYSRTGILSNPGCGRSSTQAGAPRCATKMQQTATDVHCEWGRIGNSKICACDVFCRGYKKLKMIRLLG